MKIFMRGQYSELQAFGGITAQNASLNVVKELEENQERLSNSLKVDVQNGICETMQVLNLSNQENISPNQGFIPPSFHSPHTQFQGYVNPFPQIPEQSLHKTSSQNNMFGANQMVDNPMMTQLLQQMQVMQQ